MMLRCRAPMLGLDRIGVRLLPAGRRSSSPTFTPIACANFSGRSSISRPLRCISGGMVLGVGKRMGSRGMSSKANPPPAASASSAQQEAGVELLPATNDDHGGVIIEVMGPIDSGAFVSSLRASLDNWRQQGKRGVWLKLRIELANLVHHAVEEGFWYHHAEPSYVMLVYWIPSSKCTLPVNATHRVGVGAFVMNEKKEVLVVMEKSGKLRGLGVWKFPTGVVDQGEDIFDGAVREVKEETGIDTEFVEVLAFRQSHMSFFEKSDLFFVCMLRPLSFDVRKQESEIEDAKWIPIDEFAAQPFVQKHELLKYITNIGRAKAENVYSGFSPIRIKSALSNRQSHIYINTGGLILPSKSAI